MKERPERIMSTKYRQRGDKLIKEGNSGKRNLQDIFL